MRKFLSIFAAALMALTVNAAVINIDNTTADALRTALNSAADGDEIVMAAGTYVESNGNYIAFDGKAVTVKAAEDANVLIQPQVPITVSNGGHAIFENVKIDASHLTDLADWYEHLFYVTDGNPNGYTFRGCELYGFNLNSSMFYCNNVNKVAAMKFEDCYLHDIMKSIIFVENTEGKPMVSVKNCTFANISTNTESYWAGVIDVRAAEATLQVDHCTFYNVIPMNTDYSCVSKITLAKGKVSNCIFMLPTALDNIRAMRGVTATNCITFNYLKDSGTGIHSSVTQTNCVQADPLFVDAANGNFTLGEGSPALTMNNGEAIGDPRWVPSVAPVEPLMKTIYCKMDKDWWKAEGAAVGVYTWNDGGTQKVAWPGERMTPVEGETDLWSFELDVNTYHMCIFTRVNGTGDVTDWGAKTVDLIIPTDDNDMFTITNTEATWGDPGCNGVWSKYEPTPVGPVIDPTQPYTLTFNYYDNTGSDKSAAETTLAGLFSEASMAYINADAEGTVLEKVYLGRKYKDDQSGDSIFSNVKFGTSSVAGELKFALANMNVDSVIFRAAMYGDSEGGDGFSVNGTAFTLSRGNKKFENLKYVPAGEITFLDIVQTKANKGRFYLTSITVYPKSGDTPVEPTLPQVGLGASFNEWDWTTNLLTPAQDELTASITVALEAGNHEFKIVSDGSWLSLNGEGETLYGIHREWTRVEHINLINNGRNFSLNADVAGDYTFTWTYADSTLVVTFPEAPVVSTCDWANIEFLGGPAEYANQFKVCKADGEHPGVVNIQQPGWATELGIYMTFPSAAFGEISLPATAYAVDGAGIVFYLSAFAALETEVSVVVNNEPIVFTVYNAAYEPQPAVPAYYLVGNMTEWQVVADDAHKFVANPEAEGEYMITWPLAAGDAFKAVKVEGETQTWYPEDYNDAYNVDAAHAGQKTIYFRPDGQGGEDWHYGVIYVEANEAPEVVAPAAAPADPTWPANQVKAVYSATYNADCGFGEWSSGTQYTQEEFGKKYVTTNSGYFGITFEGDAALNCTKMEKLHLDVWIAVDASIRIVPIHGGQEVGVVKQLAGQQWNAIEIALSEFEGVTNWSNVYQIKIDQAPTLTFWVNNVYFYTTVAPAADTEAPQNVTASLVSASYFSAKISASATDNSDAVKFVVMDSEQELAVANAVSGVAKEIEVKGLLPNTTYNLSVIAKDEAGNAAAPVAVAVTTLAAPAPAAAPTYAADKVLAVQTDVYTNIAYGIQDWWSMPALTVGNLTETSKAICIEPTSATPAGACFGLAFDATDITAYTALEMDVYPTVEGAAIKIQVIGDNANLPAATVFNLVANQWNHVVLNIAGNTKNNCEQIGFYDCQLMGGACFIQNVLFVQAEAPVVETNYYLVGTMTNWAVVAEDAYKFAANEAAEGEFMLNYTLAEGDQFKVVKVEGETQTWYPDGMDNNYVVDAQHAGAATIYFRPAGGVDGWHYGYIYVDTPNGINNTTIDAKAQKFIMNGQLYIIKNGVMYNAQGAVVR